MFIAERFYLLLCVILRLGEYDVGVCLRGEGGTSLPLCTCEGERANLRNLVFFPEFQGSNCDRSFRVATSFIH